MSSLSYPVLRLYTSLSLVLLIVVRSVADESHVEFDCRTQQPIGNSEDQLEDTSTCPAYIQVSTSTYYTGQSVTVSLISRYKITSFILQARSDDEASPTTTLGGPYGQWGDELRSPQRCLNAADTLIFFSPSRPLTRIRATWKSLPPLTSPELYFRATIVAADGKIWTNLRSTLLHKVRLTPSLPPAVRTSAMPRQSTELPLIGGQGSAVDNNPDVVGSNGSKNSVGTVNAIRESVMEERIIDYQQKQQLKIKDDDWGNEGDWTIEREKNRVMQRVALNQEVLFAEKSRFAEQKSQENVIRFEMGDNNRVVNFSKRRIASRR